MDESVNKLKAEAYLQSHGKTAPPSQRRRPRGCWPEVPGGLVSSTHILFRDTVDRRLGVKRGLQGKNAMCPFIRSGRYKPQEQP